MKLNIRRFNISASNSTELAAPVSGKYKYTLAVSFEETGTSTENNTSTLSCTCTLTGTKIGWNTSTQTLNFYWHDDNQYSGDTNYFIGSATYNNCGKDQVNSTWTITGNITVPHKADGTLNGYVWAWIEKNGSNQYVPASGGVGTVTTALTNIPRASSISATEADIGSSSTITINRAVSTFKHTITYSFTGVDSNNQTVTRTGIIATKTSNVQLSFTLPGVGNSNDLYPLIPNGKELVGTLICDTFSGDTYIGSSNCSIKAKVPDSAKPTVSVLPQTGTNAKIVDTDTISKNTIQCFVQGKSILSFDMSSAFSTTYSSPVDYYVLKINGEQVHSDTVNTYTMTKALPYTANTYELIIYDKRGNFNTTGEQTITAYEYVAPACSMTAERDSNTPTKINIVYSANIKNIGPNGGNNRNAHTIKIEYRQVGSTGNWTSVVNVTNAYSKTNISANATGVSDSNTFDFKITATDSYGSTIENVQVGTSATLLNFNANGNTMAFGKASESATDVEFAITTDFQKPARFKEGVQGKELVSSSGTGYVNCFSLSTTGTNITQAITFDVIQFGRSAKARILLANNGTAGNLTLSQFYKEGNSNLYYLVSNNVMTVYIQKNGSGDKIEIVNLEKGNASDVKITWNDTRVTSLPTGYGTASNRVGEFVYGVTSTATNSSTSNLMTTSGIQEAITTKLEHLTQYVLFDNASGNSGNITLSDSAENYDCLEIFYCNTQDYIARYDSVKVIHPNGKGFMCYCAWVYNSTTGGTQVMTEVNTISGTTITRGLSSGWNVEASGTWSGGVNGRYFNIVKVIGYK